jgi:N-acetylneuraminate synthase
MPVWGSSFGSKYPRTPFTDTMQRWSDIVSAWMSKTKDLILNSDEIWQMRGGIKAPAQEEQVTIDFAFATVCTIKPIKKGEPFKWIIFG